MPYTFLSDPWIAEVTKLAAEAGSGVMPDTVAINLVVTGGPEGDRELHIAGGSFGTGLSADCPTKLTLPYTVAKNMFVNGDQAAAMQAFMSGQIKVEGDMSKLMAMQAGGGPGGAADAAALQAKLQEITAAD
jgi:hypothetical protein